MKMNRIKEAKQLIKHKLAIFTLWKHSTVMQANCSLGRIIAHDLEKLFLILLIGDKLATAIHRRFAKHHRQLNYAPQHKVKYEIILDWASARITKPNKPLDALQTASKYYPTHTTWAQEVVERTNVN